MNRVLRRQQTTDSENVVTASYSTDMALVERLLARDESAYTLAVRGYHGGMLRFARSLVGAALAEEVVQETWLAVVKSLPNFAARSSLKTWIYSILGNIARTRLRSESRRLPTETAGLISGSDVFEERFDATGHWHPPPLPWHAETPEALLNAEQLRHCLEKILAALPPAQQSVLILHDSEGLKMDEICNILELTVTNGRVLLHRARTSLYAAIERYEKEGKC